MDLGILRILLVRHAVSEDNQSAIWSGHRDSPLSQIGLQQAKALGTSLANVSLQAIYSSDSKRAKQTAEEILNVNKTHPPPPLVQTQSLREQNFGKAEGRPWNDPEFVNVGRGEEGRSYRFPEGESVEDVNARMRVSLRRYVLPRLEALRPGTERMEPQVVIVAHGIAIAELLRVLLTMHDETLPGCPWPNPRESYRRVRLDNTGWTLVELGVPVNPAAQLDEAQRKAFVVRIVQQNIINHLSGHTLSPQASRDNMNATIGHKIAGGTSDATSLQRTNDATPSLLNLRTVRSYDGKQHFRHDVDRGNDGSKGGVGPQQLSPSHARSNGGTASSVSVALASAPGAWSEAWQKACTDVLPLFSNEDVRTSIENINDLVSEHIRKSLEKSPARAIDSLGRDLAALCSAGMISIDMKLDAAADEDVQLMQGLVDIWKRFHRRTLPWLEACFLPLQVDPTLVGLTTRSQGERSSSNLRTEPIDVWKTVLSKFRDTMILGRRERLFSAFLRIQVLEFEHLQMRREGVTRIRSADDIMGDAGTVTEDDQLYPCLVQMANYLHAVQSHDEHQNAMDSLIRALRAGKENRLHDGRVRNSPMNTRDAIDAANTAAAASVMTNANSSLGRSGSISLMTASLSAGGADAKRLQARQGWLPPKRPAVTPLIGTGSDEARPDRAISHTSARSYDTDEMQASLARLGSQSGSVAGGRGDGEDGPDARSDSDSHVFIVGGEARRGESQTSIVAA